MLPFHTAHFMMHACISMLQAITMNSIILASISVIATVCISTMGMYFFTMATLFSALMMMVFLICVQPMLKFARNWLSGSYVSIKHLQTPKMRNIIHGHSGCFHVFQFSEFLIANTKQFKFANWRYRLLAQPFIVLTDPHDCHYVLSEKWQLFRKSDQQRRSLGRHMGSSILLAEGADWKIQRKLLTPVFQNQAIVNLQADMISKIHELLDEVAKHDGEIVDMGFLFECLTFDVLGTAGYHHDFKCISKSDNRRLFRSMFLNFVRRGLRTIPIPTSFAELKAEIEGEYAYRKTKCIMNQVYKERLRQQQQSSSSNATENTCDENDLLGYILKEQQKYGGDHGEGSVNQAHLFDQLTLFGLAGSDTSSSFLTSVILMLSLHPNTQQNLQKELDEVFATSIATATDIPQRLNRLPYLRAVMNETLRLRPPVAAITRRALHQVTLPSGLKIDPQHEVIISIEALHTSPQIWGADASIFRPERWINDEGALVATPHIDHSLSLNKVFLPFSTGPRVCIGQNFSRNEVTLCLGELMHRFSFSLEKDLGEPQMYGTGLRAYLDGAKFAVVRRY